MPVAARRRHRVPAASSWHGAGPQPDESGRLGWTELEAVTRHPPINKDGSDTLVRVTTESGRTVTVTKGKSLLVERDGALVAVDGDDVGVGDRVPVVQALPAAAGVEALDLRTVFGDAEVVFTDTYGRSDTLPHAAKARPELLDAGCYVALPRSQCLLPTRVPLDRAFGFLIGAYLAEGCLTEHQVHIANNDNAEEYRAAATEWASRHGIAFHTTATEHRADNGGTLMLHSTLLCRVLSRTCGKLSACKRVPGFAFAAPDAFVLGLLDAYMSGDGSISKRQAYAYASTRSQKLRDGIALLLAESEWDVPSPRSNDRITSSGRRPRPPTAREQALYGGDHLPLYGVALGAVDTIRFAEAVDMTLTHTRSAASNFVGPRPRGERENRRAPWATCGSNASWHCARRRRRTPSSTT